MFTDVAYDIRPIQASAHWEGVIQKDSMWCFPKEWNFKKSMRLLQKNYGSAKSQAKKLQKWIVEDFEESKQYQKFCDEVYQPSSEEILWDSTVNEVQLT